MLHLNSKLVTLCLRVSFFGENVHVTVFLLFLKYFKQNMVSTKKTRSVTAIFLNAHLVLIKLSAKYNKQIFIKKTQLGKRSGGGWEYKKLYKKYTVYK